MARTESQEEVRSLRGTGLLAQEDAEESDQVQKRIGVLYVEFSSTTISALCNFRLNRKSTSKIR